MMMYHILNGDALAHSFADARIPGEIVVVREALIDGDLSGSPMDKFWQTRAREMGVPYIEYHDHVVSEFEKLLHAPDDSEFSCWFEYDLFCQVNLWFTISFLNRLPIRKNVFAVYSSHVNRGDKHFWTGFGPATAEELVYCFARRIMLSDADLRFGEVLWEAYKKGNLEQLKEYSKTKSAPFPFLQEVIEAHLDRFPEDGKKGRPEEVVEEIVRNVSTNFSDVFKEFRERESIYGFGDMQVKQIYDEIIRSRG